MRTISSRAHKPTVAGVALALLLTGCGGGGDESSGSGGTDELLQVGVVDDLTGAVAIAGQADVCGIKIAADALDAGSLSGRKAEITVEDGQSTPAVAAQAVTQLTGQGINLFVGGSSTSTVLSGLPILNDAGALSTGGTTKALEILEQGELVVRLNGDNTTDAEALASYVNDDLQPKSVAFVAAQGAYGEGAVASISAALDPGIEVVETQFTPGDSTDYRSVLTTVRAAQPDAVIWLIFGNAQPVAFMREYKQQGLEATSVSGPGLLTASVVQSAGADADGVVGMDVWAPLIENAANDQLKEDWDAYRGDHEECKDKPLDKQVALSYSQLALLAAAAEEAGSSDPAEIHATMLEGSWELPQGTVEFSENGQAKVTYSRYVAEDGELVSQG
jgi:branched-chain amino acid transport system substrate-binding protein